MIQFDSELRLYIFLDSNSLIWDGAVINQMDFNYGGVWVTKLVVLERTTWENDEK